MPTLTTLILGNLTIELEYTVEAGEAKSHDCPATEPSLHFGEEPGDMVAIIEDPDDIIPNIEIPIELGGYISDSEWDRLEQEAWNDYNNHPSTP